jgi:hypothetical protein
MEMASGQVSQQQQNPAIERTPRAIDAREQKGETATYHFIDNLAIAIRHTGRVLLDLIPHIYDTERTIQILGKDGSQTRVQVSPDIDSAHQVQSERDEVTEVLFNPKVGKYEVESDVGPAYASQRQEAWNAFTQLMTADNQLMNIIGDLAFLSADFPNADKIAERIKRNIRATTPWLLDDQPGPVIAKLNEQIQKQSEQIAELLQKLAENKLAVKGHAEMRDIDAYDAKTRRLTAEGNVVANIIELGHGKQELDNLLDKTMHDMNMDHIDQIQEDNEQNINSQVGGEKG